MLPLSQTNTVCPVHKIKRRLLCVSVISCVCLLFLQAYPCISTGIYGKTSLLLTDCSAVERALGLHLLIVGSSVIWSSLITETPSVVHCKHMWLMLCRVSQWGSRSCCSCYYSSAFGRTKTAGKGRALSIDWCLFTVYRYCVSWLLAADFISFADNTVRNCTMACIMCLS